MPYSELGISEKDLSFDADGNATLMRVFKVWDINPRLFFGKISNITHYQNTSVTMPDIGSVLTNVNGPYGLFGNDSGTGVTTPLRLVRYTLRPMSPIVFEAIAHYSNDPREAPLGQAYRNAAEFTVVNIPFLRYVPGLLLGVTGSTGQYVAIEDSIGVPMPTRRLSQTVTIKRSELKQAEANADGMVSHLHELREGLVCRFEGYDTTLRSPQWVDISYNWIWEKGVLRSDFGLTAYDWGDLTDPGGSGPIQPSYPTGIAPLFNLLGTAPYIVPPYHTITMNTWQPAGVPRKVAFWQYRCVHSPQPEEWRSLLGFENFEWRVVP